MLPKFSHNLHRDHVTNVWNMIIGDIMGGRLRTVMQPWPNCIVCIVLAWPLADAGRCVWHPARRLQQCPCNTIECS